MPKATSDSSGATSGPSSSSEITESEWLSALLAAQEKTGDDGMTQREIARMLGLDEENYGAMSKIGGMLRKGVRAGTVTVGLSRRKNICGRSQVVPVYRMIKQ